MRAAIDRLKKALEGKPRGHRLEGGTLRAVPGGVREEPAQLHVTVLAADVAEACGTVAAPDGVTTALMAGAQAGKLDRLVVLQADDLYHLLDLAEGGDPFEAPR